MFIFIETAPGPQRKHPLSLIRRPGYELVKRRILGAELVFAEVYARPREAARAARSLIRAGAAEAFFEKDFPYFEDFTAAGIRRADTGYVYTLLADKIALRVAASVGLNCEKASLGVSAVRVSAVVENAVARLYPHFRRIVVSVGSGGEGLCRALSKGYGVCAVRDPQGTLLDGCDITLSFTDGGLFVAPAGKEQLRADAFRLCSPDMGAGVPGFSREELICALVRMGRLRPENIRVIEPKTTYIHCV